MADASISFTVKLDPAREEALRLADQLVTDWAGQVKNERGYVHDKWAPVDLTARTEAVLRVAEWLLTKPQLLTAPPVSRETED